MIIQRWQTLSLRERILVVSGAVIIIFSLFDTFVLSPLNGHIESLREKIQTQQALDDWMQQANSRILQLRRAGFTADALSTPQEAILTLVERKLNEDKLNIYLQNVKQPQNNQLILQFHQVPFDDLLHWLQMISRQYNINVQELTASKTLPLGSAEVTLTLTQTN
jgi:type II secretory pathway component PulM